MKNINDSALKERFILTNRLSAIINPSLLATLRLVKIDAGEYLMTQNTYLTHLYFWLTVNCRSSAIIQTGRTRFILLKRLFRLLAKWNFSPLRKVRPSVPFRH